VQLVLKSPTGAYYPGDCALRDARVFTIPEGADGMAFPTGYEPVSLYAEMQRDAQATTGDVEDRN